MTSSPPIFGDICCIDVVVVVNIVVSVVVKSSVVVVEWSGWLTMVINPISDASLILFMLNQLYFLICLERVFECLTCLVLFMNTKHSLNSC